MAQRRGSGLSKSLILKGLQCEKALWLAKNPPLFDFPPQPDLKAKFRAGTEVGILAQQLFPGGVEVPYEGLSFPGQLARTKELIASGAQVIYEASFSFSAIFVKVDILVRDSDGEGDSWKLYEVKMGTGVKPVNLDDVAIQHYVLNGCGLSISQSYLVHVDNTYTRRGAIDVNQLFNSVDISTKVAARQQSMPEIVSELRQTMHETREPAVDIGKHCSIPYECDYIPYCWRHVPEQSIFGLKGRGINKFDYYKQGIVHLKDLPLEQLNQTQRHQVEATLNRQDDTHHDKVKSFLEALWYPICHLDFETFNTPIPKFDGTRPYQQVAFQFSIHSQLHEGAEPQHDEYLAQPDEDPRRQLVEQLLSITPRDSCILTYNQSFEKGVLRDLAQRFPEFEEEIELRIANIRDLMEPFRKRHVYRWQMEGSYSIKEVLPAMVPDLSYAKMDIADGMAAMRAYHEMCQLEPGAKLDNLRRSMLAYCQLDTLAMVKILSELHKIDSDTTL